MLWLSQIGWEVIACLGAALLAEATRPAATWRGSVVNVGLGIAGGAYGPQGVEIFWESGRRAHLLVTFCCGLLGSIVFKKVLDGASEWKPADLLIALGRGYDAFRSNRPKGDRGNG